MTDPGQIRTEAITANGECWRLLEEPDRTREEPEDIIAAAPMHSPVTGTRPMSTMQRPRDEAKRSPTMVIAMNSSGNSHRARGSGWNKG